MYVHVCWHWSLAICILHFVQSLNFVSLNLIGEEGKVHLPHFKYAELWCDKEVSRCRRLVSYFCKWSGLCFYPASDSWLNTAHCTSLINFAELALCEVYFWRDYLISLVLIFGRFKMHCSRQPLTATHKLGPYSRFCIQRNHHRPIFAQTSLLSLFKKL